MQAGGNQRCGSRKPPAVFTSFPSLWHCESLGERDTPQAFFSISPSYPWTDGDLLSLQCTHSLLLDPLLPD